MKTIITFSFILIAQISGFSQAIGLTQTIFVHENLSPNPESKTGYNLIFQDEFNSGSVDQTVWNVSDFNNDGTVNCLNPLDYPFTMNPSNVWEEDGYCKIKLTEDYYAGCSASSGEIKSFSNSLDDGFNAWNFDFGFYVEIRVKYLPIKSGLGSAGWLFAAGQPEYNE